MFDRGDRALGDVRINRYLRRRRNFNGNRNAGDSGDLNIVRNVDVVGNIGDIRNVDNLRDDGNFGIVGNVRLRLRQHGFIVDANVNGANNPGWRCSHGNSDGIYRDRQSWSQLRRGGTNDYRGPHCFICSGGHFPMPN
jgi:hypothetical protein